ncbi:hypothetical protein TRFO_28951 [Tritrichomonas foetus]|uniref:Uncharacterized protein n=1 Tax=Tritrichomonas foetus TaxID=1144522 RepID=A0A1J4JXA9_9EUKA|nr:hypothetical protein TRFO_28951 [Tritrichomonas foetus]|eukprot:OHT03627.1 hypothetical protein TRFO_28951 [Tritrichomonas foetus]
MNSIDGVFERFLFKLFQSFTKMLSLIFLLLYRDLCITGGESTKDSQCLKCSTSGCITFSQLAKTDLNLFDRIAIVNNSNIDFGNGKVSFSSRDSLGEIKNLDGKQLLIYLFTDKASIVITQSSKTGNQLVQFQASGDATFRFPSAISNLPAEFISSKNTIIYASASVSINGGFTIISNQNITFSNNNDLSAPIDFEMTTLTLNIRSKVILTSAYYRLKIRYLGSFESSFKDFPFEYYLLNSTISQVQIFQSEMPITGNISVSIVPYQMNSKIADRLIKVKQMPFLVISDSKSNVDLINISLSLPTKPGLFGFWTGASILDYKLNNKTFSMYLDTNLVKDKENFVCYSTQNMCDEGYTEIIDTKMENFVQNYVPSYTKILDFTILSSLPQDYIPLHEFPPGVYLHFYGKNKNKHPTIYLSSNQSTHFSYLLFSKLVVELKCDDKNGVFMVTSPFYASECELKYSSSSITNIKFYDAFISSFDFFKKLPEDSLQSITKLYVFDCNQDLQSITYTEDFISFTVNSGNTVSNLAVPFSAIDLYIEILDSAIIELKTTSHPNTPQKINLSNNDNFIIHKKQPKNHNEIEFDEFVLNFLENHNFTFLFKHNKNFAKINNKHINKLDDKIDNKIDNQVDNQIDNILKKNGMKTWNKKMMKNEYVSIYGVAFAGNGKLQIGVDYDTSIPNETSYSIDAGNIGIILSNSDIPNFMVYDAVAYYTLPARIDQSIISNILTKDISVFTPKTMVISTSTVLVNIPMTINTIMISESVTLQLSSTIFESTLIMNRGTIIRNYPSQQSNQLLSKINPLINQNHKNLKLPQNINSVQNIDEFGILKQENPNSVNYYLRIQDGINITLYWRNGALPLLELNSDRKAVPHTLYISLDIQDEKFININEYVQNYYLRHVAIVTGILSEDCESWVLNTRFKSTIPIFDQKDSCLRVKCRVQKNNIKYSDLMFFIWKNVSDKKVLPTESATPQLGKPNATIWISVVVLLYTSCTVAMIACFIIIRKRKSHFTDEETQSENSYQFDISPDTSESSN